MAEIRDLSGNVVKADQLGADPKIAKLLADLTEQNNKGRLKGLMAVYLTPEDWYGSTWAWGHGSGSSIGLMALGALAALQDELHASMRASPEMDEPEKGA